MLRLLAIVGQTASGKSEMSMRLARRFNGEIVSADSRTFYKGMDIGTAKPSAEDRRAIPHHLYDIATPDKPVNVAEYQKLAFAAIQDISSRGKLPILVGGSGLYADSVLFNYVFSPPADDSVRKQYEGLSVEHMQQLIIERNIAMPKNSKNPRHLSRALETGGVASQERSLRADTLVLGLVLENEELEKRIVKRVNWMIENGLENEVRQLSEKYGWDSEPMKAIGYREFQDFFDNDATITEVVQSIVADTLSYAKRQKTWFKRNKQVNYIRSEAEAVDLITTALNT